MTATLVVVGWEKFQHYKDRDPPWIKLYRDLFTCESWVLGTDISRLVQVASLLLAARYHNATPFQWTLVRKVANLDCTEKQFNEAVNHLVSTKFLEIQQLPSEVKPAAQSASNVLATCTSETEGEKSRAEAEKNAHAREPLPLGLDLDSWNRWEAYRREIRKPIKAASMLLAQQKLAGFGAKQAAVVDQSIAQGWTGLFAPKDERNGASRPNGHTRVSALERSRQATERWLREDEESSGGGLVIDA